MSTSSSLRQQFGAFCTNVPLGVRTLLEAPGLTTTLTAPKNGSVCVSTPGRKVFFHWFNGGGCFWKKRRSRRSVCVHPWKKGSFHHFHQAGGQCTTDRHCPTKTLSARGEAMRDAALCTCPMNFCTRCPLFWFDSWCFMCSFPLNRFPTAFLNRS